MEINTAKVLAMLALGIGSFIAGMLPAWFTPRAKQKYPLLLSSLLCYGGGVLFATSLVHMLPESREQLPRYAELMFCLGFLLIYFVDELVHLFYGAQIDKVSLTSASVSRYGATSETSNLLASAPRVSVDARQDEDLLGRISPCCGDNVNPRMCHVSHIEPCNKSATGRVGLLLALLMHSLLEGLAIGLQVSTAKVLILLAAVSSHKFVVGFCLGVELSESLIGKICQHIISILVFSMGTVIGIGTGTAIVFIKELTSTAAIPIMQGLAGGTLLYVTVSEVLPRERARWHQRNNRSAGLKQFISFTTGFTMMYLLNYYFDHDSP